MTKRDILTKIDELEEYAVLENTEVGEYCMTLLAFMEWHHDMSSPILKEAMCQEVLDQLEMFQDNCDIVDEERTETMTYKVLEWR